MYKGKTTPDSTERRDEEAYCYTEMNKNMPNEIVRSEETERVP